jgi:hypothetical protein
MSIKDAEKVCRDRYYTYYFLKYYEGLESIQMIPSYVLLVRLA